MMKINRLIVDCNKAYAPVCRPVRNGKITALHRVSLQDIHDTHTAVILNLHTAGSTLLNLLTLCSQDYECLDPEHSLSGSSEAFSLSLSYILVMYV